MQKKSLWIVQVEFSGDATADKVKRMVERGCSLFVREIPIEICIGCKHSLHKSGCCSGTGEDKNCKFLMPCRCETGEKNASQT